MSLNITKEALMDNISEIPEEFVIEAEYTEEELKRLNVPARSKATGAMLNTTKGKKDAHLKETFPVQAEDDDIEPQSVAAPKKVAKILWITMGVTLAAAAILLFVFLWNPDRRDVVTTTEAETTEVMSTEARTEEVVSTEARTEEVVPTEAGTEEVVPTEAGTTEETEGATTEVKVESDPKKIRKVNVGDYISFGSYEQDNDLENGKEAIEWLVLDKKEDKMLVISRYALDSKPYNVDEAEVTWETCTLREWLNSVFYSDAFASNEKSMVIDATVTADANPSYNTPAGNDTMDKVFLLSFDEFARYYDDFDDNRFKYCQRTQYCSVQTLMGDRSDPYAYGGNCYWWLRSPGDDPDWAMCVNFQGGVYDLGNPVNVAGITVRPAMWINVVTDSSLEETEEPTMEVTPIDLSEDVAIDEAHFPDAIFRNEVSELYDKDHDGQLNETEIKKIVGINVNNMGVSSLKGVEYFTALTRLNCEGNNISELDLTQNVNLVSIKCKGNQLTKLDVSKASALETLDCSRNQLTELNVENNPGIYSLLCGENRLTGLDIHNIMTELYLQVDVNVNVIGANDQVNIQRVNQQTQIPGEIIEGTNTLRLDNASYHWDAENDGREDWNVNRAKLTDSVLILDGPFTLTIFGDEDGDPDTILHFDRDYTEIPLGENVKYTYNAFDSNPEMINKGLGESHPINSLFFTINEGVITELGTFIGG